MARPAPRLHRLPIRTDYVLIPPPLDLSLPEIAGKSELPAIIVTPSSPSSTRDFSLAFLPSPPKPSLRQRIQSYKHLHAPGLRARSLFFFFVILFVVVCHLVAHRVAIRRPYIEFSVQTGHAHVVESAPLSWFDFRARFAGKGGTVEVVNPEVTPADYDATAPGDVE
jgi:hypothetical protein